MKHLKKLLVTICVGSLILGSLLLLNWYQYKIRSTVHLQKLDSVLTALGKKSLPSDDVPVSSLLLYRDTIIGEGYNTVLKNDNAGGHAEINAISDALQKIGFERFMKLNRDSLVLLTTFEPCPMCIGAINEYQIKNTIFYLPKKLKDRLKYMKNDLLYRNQLRESGYGELQYRLFKLHPDFDSTKYFH